MASSLMWRTGREIDVTVPQVMEEPAMKQETVEGRREMTEIIVVSNAVEGISPRERVQQRTPCRLRMCLNFGKRQSMRRRWCRRQERVQQRTAEKNEVVPQTPEETVEMLKLVFQEREQQRTAEKIEVVPQSPEETVEVGRLVLHERVQQRTVEQIEDAPPSPEKTVEVVQVGPA